MNLLVISLFISTLSVANTKASAFGLSIVPDTIPGQHQLTRQVVDDMCERLAAEHQRSPFTDLSPAQAQETFERELSAGIEKRVSSIKQLARRTKTATAYEQLRKDMPTAVAMELVKTCPAATTLFSQFSKSVGTISRAEQSFLNSWGEELCQKLDALNSQGRLQGKTPAERTELFHQEYTASLSTRGPQIMQLYGPASNNPQVVEMLGSRLTSNMIRQCPNTLLLLKPSN